MSLRTPERACNNQILRLFDETWHGTTAGRATKKTFATTISGRLCSSNLLFAVALVISTWSFCISFLGEGIIINDTLHPCGGDGAAGCLIEQAFGSNNQKSSNQRIHYQLYRNKPIQRFQDATYQCSDDGNRTPLEPKLQQVLGNFSTHIQTDLRIIVIGDSIALQLAHELQANAGATSYTRLHDFRWRQGSGNALGMIVSQVAGGGFIAFWRIVGMFQRKQENLPLPNKGAGWQRGFAKSLIKYTDKQQTTVNSTIARRRAPSGCGNAYDVVIFRVNHPWVGFEGVTSETLAGVLPSVHYWLGAETIIFVSAALNNNIMDEKDLKELNALNGRIRKYVTEEFKPQETLTVKKVLLADVARLMEEATEFNANSLGYDTSDSHYLFEKLDRGGEQYAKSIAQTCSSRVAAGSPNCPKNYLSADGQHLCVETLGARISANFACLIQCAYSSTLLLRECERACNDKFMSLKEIDSSEILST